MADSPCQLLSQLLRRADAGEPVAICAVVATRGSTPQKAGATMLVLQDGRTLGTLGGGCVEAEVRTRALHLLAAGEDRLLDFKLDADYGWDDGLVCGGTMRIAVKSVTSADVATPFRDARSELDAGRDATIDLVVPDDAGEPRPFKHVVQPTPALLLAGAGHVAQQLAPIAIACGFQVTVIDDRPDFATADRFPGATLVIGDIESTLRHARIGPSTFVVIVTRGHRHDGRSLEAVVASPARYVGLIGSKRKIVTILRDLHHRRVATAEQLARVHAPIGFDVGAVSPGEIAVSIAAELVAVRRGKIGGSIGAMRLTAGQLESLFDSPRS